MISMADPAFAILFSALLTAKATSVHELHVFEGLPRGTLPQH